MIPAHHSASPDVQDLDHRVQSVLRQGDQVLLAPVCPQGDLPLHEAFHVADLIPDGRCLFIPHGRRCVLHILLQFFQDAFIIPAQETQDSLHHLPVCLFSALSGAGRKAPADIIVHTGTFQGFGRQRLCAGTDRENIPHSFDYLANSIGADIRSEIPCAVLLHFPAELQPWKRLPHINLQIGIVLVILQQDIVIGFMKLDQVAFQDQRFQVGLAQQDVKIIDMGNHRCHFGRMGCITEIAPHPVFQVDRLAHIDNLACRVLHQVATGRVRKHPDLLFQLFTPSDHCRFSPFLSGIKRSGAPASVVFIPGC